MMIWTNSFYDLQGKAGRRSVFLILAEGLASSKASLSLSSSEGRSTFRNLALSKPTLFFLMVFTSLIFINSKFKNVFTRIIIYSQTAYKKSSHFFHFRIG
ncbi:unnamed protein product [Rhizophagus irregularis]|nr:unnamed protein product [Rhizophagus irregularis]